MVASAARPGRQPRPSWRHLDQCCSDWRRSSGDVGRAPGCFTWNRRADAHWLFHV